MRRLASADYVEARRAKRERARRRAGRPHVVEYFHQVDDGYSHLAAQLLVPLREAYDIELVCYLVGAPRGRAAPEPELLAELSRSEAAKIAPHYGLRFDGSAAPSPQSVALATRLLAAASADEFPRLAPLVGDALWTNAADALDALAQSHALIEAADAERMLAAGAKRRERLGHYLGGMFYYAGEWYWGVDRLYHLEQRLRDLGAIDASANPLAPRPPVSTGPRKDAGALTLEIYPSLRSPYTSLVFDEAVRLARATGVQMAVYPVLPMVMRDVPVPRRKGVYIFTDAAREARAQGLDWGNFVDPVGEPVRRCYSIFPWAEGQGRGVALLSAFLRAAFFDGVDTGKEAGLRQVVETAGLDWQEARQRIGNTDWQAEIERNRLAMYECGLWGVPSFRLLDADGETALAVWGQDRLWLVSREIQRLLAADQP